MTNIFPIHGELAVHSQASQRPAGLELPPQAIECFREGMEQLQAGDPGAALAPLPGVRVRPWPVETNMVYLDADGGPERVARLADAVRRQGVLFARLGSSLRFVLHRDISPPEAREAAERVRRAVLETPAA